jgi:hypothetical protein
MANRNISITISPKSLELLTKIVELEKQLYGSSKGRSAIINECIIMQSESIIKKLSSKS